MMPLPATRNSYTNPLVNNLSPTSSQAATTPMLVSPRPLFLLGLLHSVLRASASPLSRPFSTSASLPRLRVLFIRHGESVNNALSEVSVEHYRANRMADPPLTPLGERQALAVADHLSGAHCLPLLKGLNAVYVSPFLRTLQTASPLISALSASPDSPVKQALLWRDIFEVGGAFHGHEATPSGAVGTGGLSRGEIAERFKGAVKYCEDFHGKCAARGVGDDGWYGGRTRETVAEARVRVARVAGTLRRMAEDEAATGNSRTIALVVHGDFIDLILQSFLKLPEETAGNQKLHVFRTYNTCFTAVDIFADGKVAILFHNYHQHLKDLVKIEKLGIV